MQVLETIEYQGYDIDICPDEDPENPREWDTFNGMVCWHSRYDLGDEEAFNDLVEYCQSKDARFNRIVEDQVVATKDEDGEWYWSSITEEEKIQLTLESAEKVGCAILPLYLYDHSGITMNTTGFSCGWDSGQVGFIYMTPDQIRQVYMVKRISSKTRSRAIGLMKGDVEVYDHYISGEVFGYKIDNPQTGEERDSCWGFYGLDHEESDLLNQARSVVDSLEPIEENANDDQERA